MTTTYMYYHWTVDTAATSLHTGTGSRELTIDTVNHRGRKTYMCLYGVHIGAIDLDILYGHNWS